MRCVAGVFNEGASLTCVQQALGVSIHACATMCTPFWQEEKGNYASAVGTVLRGLGGDAATVRSKKSVHKFM